MAAEEEEKKRVAAAEEEEEEKKRVAAAEETLMEAAVEEAINSILKLHLEEAAVDILEEKELIRQAMKQTSLEEDNHVNVVTVSEKDNSTSPLKVEEELPLVTDEVLITQEAKNDIVVRSSKTEIEKWQSLAISKRKIKFFQDLRTKVQILL